MEYSDDRIIQLIHEMKPDKREKLLQRLVRENEAAKERSIDEWNAISFEEVKALDCFVIKEVDHEA